MKVILVQDVKSLGKSGDVIDVRTGYGLNYLMPEGLAVLATPEALRNVERVTKERAQDEAAGKQALNEKASALNGKRFEIESKAKEGKLFGSISKKEIRALLSLQGTAVEERQIILDKPLKQVGEFPINFDFGSGIKASAMLVIKEKA
ncbi:MAG: 50S ribosomal protein L9 [Candidatus Moranbacteria bacterium RIFCSPHIGHO2_01_FULL_55_24]|nr:MAG: 50S ribosomal protein L9 [Candidatus Moranbacteria bacterium RIFCSPHIGHO2_01_FULL_55_24]